MNGKHYGSPNEEENEPLLSGQPDVLMADASMEIASHAQLDSIRSTQCLSGTGNGNARLSEDSALIREDDERTRILTTSTGSHKEYVVYPDRWYILALFSMMALANSSGWNTWGPIQDTAKAVFSWSDSNFALLANWGAITFLSSAPMFSWLLHTKGLRLSVLVAAGCLVIGMGIRCLPVGKEHMIWSANMGQLFIGLSAPILMSGVTTLSAQWFASNERTTATAISSTTAYLGVAASFLIGPQIVQDIYPTHTNESTVSPLELTDVTEAEETKEEYDPLELQIRLTQIKTLLLVEFAWTVCLFVAALIYFPATPITPPTASAIAEREDMKSGLLAIVKFNTRVIMDILCSLSFPTTSSPTSYRKRQFWIPALAFSVSTGSYNSWSTQLVAIFNNKVDQPTAAWMGFFCNLVGVIGGIVFGKFVDSIGGKMKIVLLTLVCGCCGSFLWASLLANSYIPFSTVQLYISVILFGFFINSTVPIYFEITVEGAFPVGEETTTVFMLWLTNIFSLLFLLFPMIPSLSNDFAWLNWIMLASVVVCVPLILFYKEQYNRLNFDVDHHDDVDEEDLMPSTEFENGPQRI
ncbi:solute carrier family 49 member 4 homolog [Diadema antillarum]|uniref:solute carrier family 49 member 4 homolog n=1 Tax=Diadema antillarum TaxID=105358 RepID=UPI003A841C4E